MLLIIWFLGLVAAGDVLSYLVGLFVEYEWGSVSELGRLSRDVFHYALGRLAYCRMADKAQASLYEFRRRLI